ncbi:uncharacterized protein [Magallana gigas]|uniref:uncharacterized protein isoform X2 n=1 Tax=Magallana gigas TaxID=29159 RepID=UPI0033419E71
MVLVRILLLSLIFWFITSVIGGSVCGIRQLFPSYPLKYDKVCGLNDIEQLGDIQETIEQPQKLSKHCESTPAEFEKTLLNIEDQILQVKIHHADELNKVHENYQKLIEQLDKRLDSFKRGVDELQSKNSKLNGKLNSFERNVVSLESHHSTLNDILDSTTKDVAVLKLGTSKLTEDLGSFKRDLLLLQSNYSTMKETLVSLGRDVMLLKSENSSLNEGLVSLNGVMNSLQSQHSTLKENFTRQSESSWYHIEQLNKSHHEMQRNQSEIQTKYEKERLEASEKFDKMQKKIENGEMIFVVLSFAFAFWVAFSKMKPVNLTNPSKEKTLVLQSKAVQTEPAVRKRKSMENSIGVVSFGRSGSDVHKELVESVRSLTKLSVEIPICHSVVVRAEDICKIPPSKLVFVFVDANKRHIILEDPDQEIGGFRGQTVDAIKEMGCDVFVVYVRDKALDDGSLYHPRLTSIKRHHTLTSLSDTNRVLSLNTTFSEYQRDFLVKELQNAFNCSKTGIV